MKLQIHTDGATLEEAEDFLEKSLLVKKECSHDEKYASPYLNELHDYLAERHAQMVNDIIHQVKLEVQSDAHKKRHF